MTSFDRASLSGKYAVVTGSTQGLGEATARLLAERGAAGIIITGRNAERGEAVAADLQMMGCQAHFVQADLVDASACQQIMKEAEQHFSNLHVLVNSAALTARGSLWDTSTDLWDRMMNINLRAPFLLMQGAAQMMRRNGIPGSIVNVSSVESTGGQAFLLPYATSKGALNTLTKNVAFQGMRYGIRANAINVGWMDSPAEHEIQQRYHNAGPDWVEEAASTQPFGRLLQTEEVARAIAFLASDESGMMTGAVVHFDQSVPGAGLASKPPQLDDQYWQVESEG